MKKKLSKNILIPCLCGAFVGIASMILYQIPLLHLLVLPAVFVPLSIVQYKRYSLFKQWVVVLTSAFLWVLVELAFALLTQYCRWAEYIFYFPFYHPILNSFLQKLIHFLLYIKLF